MVVTTDILAKIHCGQKEAQKTAIFWLSIEFFRVFCPKTTLTEIMLYPNQGFVLLNFYCNKNAIIANIQ